jgi:hypothetical protein
MSVKLVRGKSNLEQSIFPVKFNSIIIIKLEIIIYKCTVYHQELKEIS